MVEIDFNIFNFLIPLIVALSADWVYESLMVDELLRFLNLSIDKDLENFIIPWVDFPELQLQLSFVVIDKVSEFVGGSCFGSEDIESSQDSDSCTLCSEDFANCIIYLPSGDVELFCVGLSQGFCSPCPFFADGFGFVSASRTLFWARVNIQEEVSDTPWFVASGFIEGGGDKECGSWCIVWDCKFYCN